MGKSAPKPPKPPDPRETSAASTGTNIGTAIANAYLGNVNQRTPYGDLVYDKTGTHNWYDPYTKRTYEIPTFTAYQKLSDEQQKLHDTNTQAQQNLSEIGRDQSAFLKDYLSKPADLDNSKVEGHLMELGRRRLDPVLEERNSALDARLANQGIQIGSKAYETAKRQASEADNDAYTSLLLSGRSQAVQEALTERNQPINEISALLSGSQVTQPNFVPTSMPTIPTTDVAGLINNEYDQRLGIWQQQQAQRQAQQQNILGGLFGLGGSILSLSDRRAKRDVKKVGRLMGQNVYSYRYKKGFDDGQRHVGVMAQEAEKTRPDAVATGADGLKRVDYGKLFTEGAV